MKPPHPQHHEAARSTTPATSFSSSSASVNSSDDEKKQARDNRSSSSTLHTAKRAPSSVSTTIMKRTTKAAALVAQSESDDESLPDDGIPRVSWDAFLRFPPKILTKEGNGEHNDTSKKRLKRKRPESGRQGHDRQEEERNSTYGDVPKPKKIKMTWKGRFGQLREYYETHGNTRVPQSYPEDQHFSHWVVQQRRKYTKRIRGDDPEALSDSRFALLESLGFEAQKRAGEQQPKETIILPPPPPPPKLPQRDLNPKFQKRLDQLHAFKEVFNHMKVPKHYEIVKGLHLWVKNIHAHPGLLLDEEREALLDIGFKWSGTRQEFNVRPPPQQNKTVVGEDQKKKKALNATWVKRIKQLKEYHKEFGDFRVPVNYERDPSLGAWVQAQYSKFNERKEGKKESLADHKFEALEKLGFGTYVERVDQPKKKTLSATWLKRLEQLKSCKEEHENFRVPIAYDKDPSLGAWVKAQSSKFTERKRGKKGFLSDHKFEALEKIGFEAHTEQPSKPATVVEQFTKPAAMEQPTEPVARLATSKWLKRLKQLKSFKEEHGHCQVPEAYKKDPSLHFWLKKQQLRFKLRKGGRVEALAEHKFRALQDLGLGVGAGKKPAHDEFATRLAQLKAFKKEHGHTLVGKDCTVPGLRNWANALRRQHKKKELGQPSDLFDDHVDALDSIGFVWIKKKNSQKTASSAGSSEPETPALSNTKTAEKTPNKVDPISHNGSVKKKAGSAWEQHFEKLKIFQSAHGHCRLDSAARKDDPVFAAWVQKQRERYTQKARGDNVLAEHKYEAFRSLGFEPCATRQPLSEAEFEKKFALLNQFKRKFGHVRVPADSPLPGLGSWVDLVRQAYRKKQKGENSKLTQDQIDMLGDVGFEWFVPDEQNIPATASTTQGHTIKSSPVDPRRGVPEKQDTVVTSSTKGSAPDKSPADPGEGQDIYVPFTMRLEQLASFHHQYEHTKVPIDYTEAPGLREWLDTMRHQYVNNRQFFTEDNLALLNSLKFDWMKDPTTNQSASTTSKHESPDSSNIWFGYLKELKKYKFEHGDTRVPKRHKNNQRFADWVYEQRTGFSKRCNGDKAALSDQRYFALEEIGFEMATIGLPSAIFQQRMTELKDFYGIFGHTKVHKTYNGAPGLRKWLAALRIKYKLWEEGDPTAISVCELDRLEGLGFDWLSRKGKFASKKNDDSPSKYTEDATEASASVGVDLFRKHDTSWAGRFKQLEDFKAAHGHINTPTIYETDQSFSNWVRTQKRLFSQRTRGLTDALADDRFEALQRVGFESNA